MEMAMPGIPTEVRIQFLTLMATIGVIKLGRIGRSLVLKSSMAPTHLRGDMQKGSFGSLNIMMTGLMYALMVMRLLLQLHISKRNLNFYRTSIMILL